VRIEKACKLLAEKRIDALLIEDPSDVFYLTGQWCSVARLILKPDRAVLLVDGRYFESAKENAPCEVALSEKEALKKFLARAKRVGFDSAFVTVEKAAGLEKSAPNKEWVPLPKPLKTLRLCKDEQEIALLKRAAKVTAEGYLHVLKELKEGIEEQELALSFEIHCRQHGASKFSFESIVACGENSAFPHYRAGRTRVKKNQAVLFDLGAVVEQYRGDMTRVFFFGQPTKEMERLYGLVKQAHDLAAASIRPGTRLGDLDRLVRAFFAKEGVDQLFPHSLGHGVGIDVHEPPLVREDSDDKDMILKPGMVFTIEPGLYLPGVGGARYENTWAVTENGAENFYAAL